MNWYLLTRGCVRGEKAAAAWEKIFLPLQARRDRVQLSGKSLILYIIKEGQPVGNQAFVQSSHCQMARSGRWEMAQWLSVCQASVRPRILISRNHRDARWV